MESNLARILYSSTANFDYTEKDLLKLLNVARENNSKLNITGLLLYNGKKFFQILEGPFDQVKKTFEKIKLDSGHSEIKEIAKEEISKRSFGAWSMGFERVNSNDLSKLEKFDIPGKIGVHFMSEELIEAIMLSFCKE